jgi:hypothetical protein
MYHTDLPLSDFRFLSGGPGGEKLVTGRLRAATTALARETPGLEEDEDVEPEELFELPHAVARAAATTTAANVANTREGRGFTRFLTIWCLLILSRGAERWARQVEARLRSRVVRVTATTNAAP